MAFQARRTHRVIINIYTAPGVTLRGGGGGGGEVIELKGAGEL
jgi:hypothetical protein